MRTLTLLTTILFSTILTFAKLNGDGYYRIHNYKTERYVYITDDKAKINLSATTIDMNAIELWKGFEKASCDPSTVCYIKNCGDNKYDIQTQGTSIYEMIEYYLSLKERNGSYLAYASSNGLTKYLGDGERVLEQEKGVMVGEASGEYRQWNITQVTLEDNAYFGIKPTIELNKKFYHSFFASFPFSFADSGMRAMYISKVDNGMAVCKELNGSVAAETPIFIECSSDQPIKNKLNLGGEAPTPSDNILKGVYFNNSTKAHNNQVAYDSETMRILGIMSDGNLGFIKSDISFIPANSCYLTVPANSPDQIKIVTEQEYNDIIASTPKSIILDKTTVEILEGDTITLKASVTPTTVQTTLNWISSNNQVAKVSENGTVTAISSGTANITVSTHNGLSATCLINVQPKSVNASSISLNINETEMKIGESINLIATIQPDNATNKTVIWSSDNAKIATVDENGVVSAIAEGETEIKVSTSDGSGLSASCIIKVTKKIILAQSITINQSEISIEIPAEFTLSVIVLPENTDNKIVKWESNNTEVATVDDDGNVKVLVEGEAIITATTTDGSNLSASCIINAISSVEDIFVDQKPKEVYTLTGIYVGTVTSPTELSPGIYIIDKQKVIIK